MLVACGEGEKKSEKEKSASATETTTEKAEKVSEESTSEKKVIPINEVGKNAVSTSESEENVVTESSKSVKSSPKKAPKILTNDTESLIDIIEAPIDDIVVDEPIFHEEKPVNQGKVDMEKVQSDQPQAVDAQKKEETNPPAVEVAKEEQANQPQSVEVAKKEQTDQPQTVEVAKKEQTNQPQTVEVAKKEQTNQPQAMTKDESVDEVEKDQPNSDNSPVYELDEKNESVTVEAPKASDNAEGTANSEVPEISEKTMEGEFSKAEPSTNEVAVEEDFIM